LLSDGDLLPSEILRRAEALNFEAIAITDHVDSSNMDSVVTRLIKASEELRKYFKNTKLIPGVELTHIPSNSIDRLATKARRLGAKLILVHGETIVEPVEVGTNHKAVESDNVNILAHPGLISKEDAKLAKNKGIYLELSSRAGHCLTNGHIVRVSEKTGAKLLVNTDSHEPEDLISQGDAFKVAIGAGSDKKDAIKIIKENTRELLKKIDRN
jgi:histidinol phosphatase-like PHP family hydrolase